jgi:phosphate starvation-inducible protein PhoH and related proteins
MSRRRREKNDPTFDMEGAVAVSPKARRVRSLEPQTDNQATYIHAIQSSTLTFGLGPAGTGKTFVATCLALDALQKKKIEKIILTRPAQEAGEKLGYLPGELDEKYEPYLRPFRDIMIKRLGQGYIDCAIKNGRIEPLPLGYMRGMTFENCWVLFDEAQNCTPVQMKMFLSRIGEHCKVIVNGDATQKDIPGPSGLVDGFHKTRGLNSVASVEFDTRDIVRSGLARDIVERYERPPEDNDMQGVHRYMQNA